MAADGFLPADLCEDLLCCTICYEPFTETRVPKSLPCLHTLCHACLKGCIKLQRDQNKRSTSGTAESGKFPCPVCKEIIPIPKNGVKGFKDDFRIRKISEAVAKGREMENGASGDSGKKCEVCKIFDKESCATLYCVECMKLLCEECSEKHLGTGIGEDHTMVSSSHNLLTSVACEDHPSEELRYCCRDCEQKPVCVACTFSEEHKEHDIVKLREETGSIKEEVVNLMETCSQKISGIRNNVKEFDSLQSRLHSKTKSVTRAVLSRTLQEICRARSKQAKMEEELENITKDKHELLQTKRQDTQEKMEALEEFCIFADKICKKGQDLQVVSMHAEMIARLKDLGDIEKPSYIEQDEFVDLGKFESLFQHERTTQEAEDSQTRSSIVKEMRRVVTQMRMMSVDREDEPGPKLLQKIGSTGVGDEQFRFPSGVTFLPNGDLVVCDMHNQRIQIFGLNLKLKNIIQSEPFKPCGVAVTKGGDLVVTDADRENGCLRIFSSDGIQKNILGEGMFSYPFSVAVDTTGQFVVSDPGSNKLVVLAEDGTRKIDMDTRSKFGLYVAVNNRDEVFLSDWHNHCIRIFSANGRLVRKIGSKGAGDGNLLLPLGVCCDPSGNLIVLDCR